MTQDEQPCGLEAALTRTEADATSALRAAAAATRALKRFHSAAQVGNLHELRPAIAAAEQALAELGQQLARASDGWDFDEERYFADGSYSREIVRAARQAQVQIFEEDDRLYCYPALVRIQASDRSVLIDRVRERRLRPSVLVSRLKDLQGRPQRFKPEAFLEALYDAYAVLAAGHGRQVAGGGRVEKLRDVYNLFTLLPGQARDYSRQEFGRDLYLLDQSGITTTRKGYRLGFHASTSTRASGSTIRVITESGRDKVYYGISFKSAE